MNGDISKFGWASVQLDGGIESVTKKIWNLFYEKLFSPKNDLQSNQMRKPAGLGNLRLALITPPDSPVSVNLSMALAKFTQLIVNAGGMIVIPSNSDLVHAGSAYLQEISENPADVVRPSLSYGQRAPLNKETGVPMGLHVMETTSDTWVETITGLGATGVELMLTVLEGRKARIPTPSNPMFPLIRVVNSAGVPCGTPNVTTDSDLVLTDNGILIQQQNHGKEVGDLWCDQLLDLVGKVASKELTPKTTGNFDFQIARGPLGISM